MRDAVAADDQWALLEAEIATWRSNGQTVTFWWRDDDAQEWTPALDRLRTLSQQMHVPLALAVIPRNADESLTAEFANHPGVSILQHGWAHANHAADGRKKAEFGDERPLQTALDELRAGAQKLGSMPSSLPVLVPPWNRIDPHIVAQLSSIGLSGLSVHGPRPSERTLHGVNCSNVHVDIVDWRGSRKFVGLAAALSQVHNHLYKKRIREVDASEPTGLMTHHLSHDEDCWWFITTFIERTKSEPSVRWLDAREIFCS